MPETRTTTERLADAIKRLADEHSTPNGFFFWEIRQYVRAPRIVLAGMLARPSAALTDALKARGLVVGFEKREDAENPARISVESIEEANQTKAAATATGD